MTPDRMSGWLAKVPKGAMFLELCADDKTQGLVELAVWERPEVDELKGTDGDVAESILAMAKDYTEAEDVRQSFILRWHGKRGKILKSVTHWQSPVKPENGVESEASLAEVVVKAMVTSNTAKDKAMVNCFKASNDAYKASAEAYENTISMLTKRLHAAQQSIDEMETSTVTATAVVVSEVAEAEIAQRTEALRALTDKIPDLIEAAITFGASKLLEKEDFQAAVAKATAEAVASAAADN